MANIAYSCFLFCLKLTVLGSWTNYVRGFVCSVPQLLLLYAAIVLFTLKKFQTCRCFEIVSWRLLQNLSKYAYSNFKLWIELLYAFEVWHAALRKMQEKVKKWILQNLNYCEPLGSLNLLPLKCNISSLAVKFKKWLLCVQYLRPCTIIVICCQFISLFAWNQTGISTAVFDRVTFKANIIDSSVKFKQCAPKIEF